MFFLLRGILDQGVVAEDGANNMYIYIYIYIYTYTNYIYIYISLVYCSLVVYVYIYIYICIEREILPLRTPTMGYVHA